MKNATSDPSALTTEGLNIAQKYIGVMFIILFFFSAIFSFVVWRTGSENLATTKFSELTGMARIMSEDLVKLYEGLVQETKNFKTIIIICTFILKNLKKCGMMNYSIIPTVFDDIITKMSYDACIRDRIGLGFRHPSLHRPITVPFITLLANRHICVEPLLNEHQKVTNKYYEDIDLKEKLQLSVTIIHKPIYFN